MNRSADDSLCAMVIDMENKKCVFCDKPVTETNFQEIVQTVVDKEFVGGTMSIKQGPARSLWAHSICGDIPEEAARLPQLSQRLEPRTVFYVDVGDLPPPETALYLQRVLANLRLRGDDKPEVFIVPVRKK